MRKCLCGCSKYQNAHVWCLMNVMHSWFCDDICFAKISVYKHWGHFRPRGSKSLVRVVGKRAFELVKSFAHRRISNTIFGRCRYSDFLQTFAVKHYHNILTSFQVSEWNLAYMWIVWSTLKLSHFFCFCRFLPTTNIALQFSWRHWYLRYTYIFFKKYLFLGGFCFIRYKTI